MNFDRGVCDPELASTGPSFQRMGNCGRIELGHRTAPVAYGKSGTIVVIVVRAGDERVERFDPMHKPLRHQALQSAVHGLRSEVTSAL